MSKTNLIILGVLMILVLYFVITKANTALSKGQSALKQQVVTPEEQAQDIIDRANLPR